MIEANHDDIFHQQAHQQLLFYNFQLYFKVRQTKLLLTKQTLFFNQLDFPMYQLFDAGSQLQYLKHRWVASVAVKKGDNDDKSERQSIYQFDLDLDLQPFFQGQILQDRMKLIRHKFIEPVRSKYNEELFEKNMKYFRMDLTEQEKTIIQKVKYYYWDQEKQCNFQLIRAYTHEKISRKIIKLVNTTLRKQEFIEQNLQLCNQYELYLLTKLNFVKTEYNCLCFCPLTKFRPKLDNFQGKTYRGFNCYGKDYRQFLEMMEKPLEERVISVPLSLWGSSKSLSEAQRFFVERKGAGRLRTMLSINVISLDKEDLDFYRQKFPTSIVSTICAVDISSLSYEKQQQEVLLRGSFCLILKISKSISSVDEMEYEKIECVMVNANRDHISTDHLGDQAEQARDYFAAINKKARMTFAERFLREEQQVNNADYFKKKMIDESKKLELLTRRLRAQK